MRGTVVGWHLPVLVADEKTLNRNGVRVVMMMRRMSVGKASRGFEQAVGITIMHRQMVGRRPD